MTDPKIDAHIARLEARRAAIDEKLAQLREQQLTGLIEQLRERIDEYGITANDLFGRKSARKTKGKK